MVVDCLLAMLTTWAELLVVFALDYPRDGLQVDDSTALHSTTKHRGVHHRHSNNVLFRQGQAQGTIHPRWHYTRGRGLRHAASVQ